MKECLKTVSGKHDFAFFSEEYEECRHCDAINDSDDKASVQRRQNNKEEVIKKEMEYMKQSAAEKSGGIFGFMFGGGKGSGDA